MTGSRHWRMGPTTLVPARSGRVLFVACLVLGTGVAFFAVSIVPGVRSHPGYSPVFDGVGTGLYGVAAAVVSLRTILCPRNRLAWAVLAVGMGSYAAGDAYYLVVQRTMAVIPTPSVDDVLNLGFYPCAYIFVVLQLRKQVGRLQASVWLDGAVPALGAAAMAAAFVFGVVVTDTQGSVAAVITNLAYPLSDLVLLTVIIGALSLFRWRPPLMWWLVGLGLAGFSSADTVYLFEASRNTYQPGTWLDLMWISGLALLAIAAVRTDIDSQLRPTDLRRLPVVASLFTLTSVALLVISSRRHLPLVAVVLAAATVLAAVTRTWLTFREVTQLAESRRLARTDDLTGLPNRRHFHAAVTAGTASGQHDRLAVLLMDLDRFKEINDSLGHHIGDQLLALIGPRLNGALPEDNLLARLGGDEFGILLFDAGVHRASEVADALLASLRDPFELVGVSLHVDASVGIALFPDHADDVDGLLQRADIAMYRAKHTHTGFELSQPDIDCGSYQRMKTIADLRVALDEDQFVLHYQPKLDLRTHRVCGVEALVRWQHPTRGLLYPDTFLPLAEQAGLMRRVTLIVLETALRQALQ